jgi:hypothetical protein
MRFPQRRQQISSGLPRTDANEALAGNPEKPICIADSTPYSQVWVS